MKLSLFELLYGLSEALDHVESEWHPLPKVHAKKTAYFAVRMGECAGLKKEKLYQLALAGLFHDSGITRSQGGLCRGKRGDEGRTEVPASGGRREFYAASDSKSEAPSDPFSQGKRGTAAALSEEKPENIRGKQAGFIWQSGSAGWRLAGMRKR